MFKELYKKVMYAVTLPIVLTSCAATTQVVNKPQAEYIHRHCADAASQVNPQELSTQGYGQYMRLVDLCNGLAEDIENPGQEFSILELMAGFHNTKDELVSLAENNKL